MNKKVIYEITLSHKAKLREESGYRTGLHPNAERAVSSGVQKAHPRQRLCAGVKRSGRLFTPACAGSSQGEGDKGKAQAAGVGTLLRLQRGWGGQAFSRGGRLTLT